MKVDIKRQDWYARVTVTGKYDHELAKQTFYNVLEFCHIRKIDKIMVDYRLQEGRQNFIQKVDYIMFIMTAIREIKTQKLVKVVYISPEDISAPSAPKKLINRDRMQIYETHLEEDAVTWLKEDNDS